MSEAVSKTLPAATSRAAAAKEEESLAPETKDIAGRMTADTDALWDAIAVGDDFGFAVRRPDLGG